MPSYCAHRQKTAYFISTWKINIQGLERLTGKLKSNRKFKINFYCITKKFLMKKKSLVLFNYVWKSYSTSEKYRSRGSSLVKTPLGVLGSPIRQFTFKSLLQCLAQVSLNDILARSRWWFNLLDCWHSFRTSRLTLWAWELVCSSEGGFGKWNIISNLSVLLVSVVLSVPLFH